MYFSLKKLECVYLYISCESQHKIVITFIPCFSWVCASGGSWTVTPAKSEIQVYFLTHHQFVSVYNCIALFSMMQEQNF